MATEAPVKLPPYEVVGKQISDYGMGLRLNLGAMVGRWKYVKVGDVVPGSAADNGGLRRGMEIVEIDGIPAVKLGWSGLRRVFWKREVGDSVTLLVRQDEAEPREIVLRVNRHRIHK